VLHLQVLIIQAHLWQLFFSLFLIYSKVDHSLGQAPSHTRLPTQCSLFVRQLWSLVLHTNLKLLHHTTGLLTLRQLGVMTLVTTHHT